MLAGLTKLARAAGRWSLGHAVIRTEEYLFDYVLYPFMLYRGGHAVLEVCLPLLGIRTPPTVASGYWAGFAVLVLASITLNLIYLRLYDRSRTDWFGFETLKTAIERFAPAGGVWGLWRVLVRHAAFLYLCVWHSPLFGTLFMRRAGEAYVMTAADGRVFGLALLVANLGWAGLVSGAVEVAKVVLRHLS